jgi:hypothetical protein
VLRDKTRPLRAAADLDNHTLLTLEKLSNAPLTRWARSDAARTARLSGSRTTRPARTAGGFLQRAPASLA